MHDTLRHVDPAGTRPEYGVDGLLCIELSWPNQQLLDQNFAAQITFRERRSFVWRLILFANQRYPCINAVLPQRDGSARSGEAGAEDHEISHHTSMCSASPSTRER